MSTKNAPLQLTDDLQARLNSLAAKTGRSSDELAEDILREHIERTEREISEAAEDEARWQRYLETGQTVPLDSIRGKLHTLAAQAVRQVEPQ